MRSYKVKNSTHPSKSNFAIIAQIKEAKYILALGGKESFQSDIGETLRANRIFRQKKDAIIKTASL